MPDSKIVHSDAVQKVITKMLADLKSTLSVGQFSALESLAQEGRLLDVDSIMAIVEESSDNGAEQ